MPRDETLVPASFNGSSVAAILALLSWPTNCLVSRVSSFFVFLIYGQARDQSQEEPCMLHGSAL